MIVPLILVKMEEHAMMVLTCILACAMQDLQGMTVKPILMIVPLILVKMEEHALMVLTHTLACVQRILKEKIVLIILVDAWIII